MTDKAFLTLVFLFWLPLACAGVRTPPGQPSVDADTYRSLRRMLDQAGPSIDYDTLMHVYRSIGQTPRPVAALDDLLGRLILKRNGNPRVDQMILIFAARIIGDSTVPIPNVQVVFRTILQQEARLNEWVLAYVSDAVVRYPFDLENGDALVDLVESQHARIRSKDRSGEEYFGFHFLPPPKSVFIKDYLDSIEAQALRQQERHRYYLLIVNQMDEAQIESALREIQRNGAPDSGADCPLLLECLVRWKLGQSR